MAAPQARCWCPPGTDASTSGLRGLFAGRSAVSAARGAVRMLGASAPSKGVERPMSDVEQNIAALLSEDRVFEPPEEFRARAIVRDPSIYERAAAITRASGPSRPSS